jgi:hypothetical protein
MFSKRGGERRMRIEVGLVLGGELEGGFELVPEGLHVEIDGAVEPLFVLLGGIAASFMIPSPKWFVAADLPLACLHRAWLGLTLAQRVRGPDAAT